MPFMMQPPYHVPVPVVNYRHPILNYNPNLSPLTLSQLQDGRTSPAWESYKQNLKDVIVQGKKNVAEKEKQQQQQQQQQQQIHNDASCSAAPSAQTTQKTVDTHKNNSNNNNQTNPTSATTSSTENQSKGKSRRYATVGANLKLVSKDVWNDAIQDIITDLSKLKKQTNRNKYPKLWKVAGIYGTAWKEDGWYAANRGTSHLTNFKNKIIHHIIATRRHEDLSHNDDLIKSILKVRKSKSEAEERAKIMEIGEVFVYEQEVFIDYCIRHYMKDWNEKGKAEEPYTDDDIARLVSVMGMNKHRKDLLSLAEGKAKTRREIDGAYPNEVQVFRRIAVDFNNEAIIVKPPTDAAKLDTKLDPNDKDRIALGRHPLFLLGMYKTVVMGEYKTATHKWRKGTGGGPGYPENFHNWNERDTTLFANYGGGKGTRIKKDYLAYILMVDIDCKYAFSSKFAPAPTDSVLEDGDVQSVIDVNADDDEVSMPASKRARKSGNATQEIDGLKEVFNTINRINNKINDTIEKVNNDNNNHTNSFSTSEDSELSTITQKMKRMNEALKLCTDLEERIIKLRTLPDDDETKAHKLRVTKDALDEAVTMMEKLSKRNGQKDDE